MPKPGNIQSCYKLSGLNQGPSDLQSDALPTELFRRIVFTINFQTIFKPRSQCKDES